MNKRDLKDKIAEKIMLIISLLVVSISFIMAYALYHRSKPIIEINSLKNLLFSSSWNPLQGHFGLSSFIVGTLWVTLIAILIGVPLSLMTAIFLSEYAPKKIRAIMKPTIDLLAGISPVIYGVWGIVIVVPIVRDYFMPFFTKHFHFFPFASDNFTGFSALSAGIVLSIMITPIIISIAEEVLRTVPFEIRETALALGATKWQTIKHTVLKKAWPGIIASVILGLSRAFGETMAVLMVAGCTLHGFPKSIFDAAYPLPALIANTYGEMMSIQLYDSAVLLAALILLVVVTLFSMIGWGILLKIERRNGGNG